MTFKELKKFNFENYHQQMGFVKENNYYSMKHQKKRNLQLFAIQLSQKNT